MADENFGIVVEIDPRPALAGTTQVDRALEKNEQSARDFEREAKAAMAEVARAAREAAKVLRLRVGPTPPCPAPVPGAPGGICGADGDQDFFDGFCQPHHAAHNGTRVAVGVRVIHKGLVDLDEVDVIALQVRQRRVARAKVIHRHPHTTRMKLVHRGGCRLRIIDRHALGQFKF